MQANWNAQGAQRRRRILIDDAISPPVSAATKNRQPVTGGAGSREERARRSYEAAALDCQPRISDLIPRSAWLLALLMVLWLLLVSGITYLHLQCGTGNLLGRKALAPFDFAGNAGLATWFASATLFLAAIGSLQVYVIRRHKTDDYRGTYRLWFWAAAWLVLASLETTAGLRDLLREAAVHFPGVELAGSGDLWSMLLIGLPSIALGIRMAFEMAASKGSVVVVIAAGLAYGYAAVLQLGYIPLEAYLAILHRGTALLAAHSLVLATVAVYARHVVLDARGQQKKKVKKQNRETARKTQQSAEKSASEPASEPQRAAKRPKSRQTHGGDATSQTSSAKSKRLAKRADANPVPVPTKGAEIPNENVQQDLPKETRKSRRQKQREQKQLAEQQKAEQRKAEQQRAEQEKAEQRKAEQQKAEQRRAEKQEAEQQKNERKRAEKQQAEQQKAERKRAEQQKAEKQKAERRKAEQQQNASKQENRKGTSATQPAAKQKPAAQKPAIKVDEQVPDFEEILEDQGQFRGLSKSERRKMRKIRRSQVRRAA